MNNVNTQNLGRFTGSVKWIIPSYKQLTVWTPLHVGSSSTKHDNHRNVINESCVEVE